VQIGTSGTAMSIGPVQITDDTASGPVTTYSGSASTPPSSGIPSD